MKISSSDFFQNFQVRVLFPWDIPKNQELLKEAFKIRHQVYCIEDRFSGFPSEIDGDEYDDQSAQILLYHTPSETWVGTCRIILYDGKGNLLFHKYAQGTFEYQDFFEYLVPYEKTAELSRLVLLRQVANNPLAMLGLFNGMFLICHKLDIQYLYIMMTRVLARRLASFGIKLFPVTPEVDYYGLRKGYIMNNNQILKDLEKNNREAYQIITKTYADSIEERKVA